MIWFSGDTERPFHLSITQDNSTLLERKNINGRPMGVIKIKFHSITYKDKYL